MKKIAVINLMAVLFLLSFGYVEAQQMCTTKPLSQFPASPVNGQAANNLMNGVTVTRSYSGTPKVYTGDLSTYCSGSTYDNYTIILPASGYSSKVIYTFSKPITNAEIWLMVMGSPATEKDKVKLSTNNGTPTFSIVYDCARAKGQPAATLSSGVVTSYPHIVTDVAVRVNSNTPFTKLIVEDINGTGSSGVLVELCPSSITPAETISITTQPQSQTICANATATFTSKAQLKDATGNIKYKWQQSSNGTTWTDIPSFAGTIASGGTTTLTTAGATSYKYRVEYSYQFTADVVVTATSQEATLTKLPSVALPTLSSTTTLCPTATNNNVSFANYVTAPTGTTLLWYATSTATVSNTIAPTINTNVITRTTKTAYVRALSSAGCTSGLVTVTLTVNDTTAPTFNAPAALNIVCNSTTATAAINTWLGTATATDACGAIATITNDYIAPANLCNVSGGVITVTFVAKDTFGNVLTKTSTIKLGVTPLIVVSDTFTVGNGLTATTTGSVLNNDRLNGNVPTAGPSGTVSITNITPATPVRVGTNVPVLNANDGKVNVPTNTPAGTYTISYRICEVANNNNCTSTTVTVKVVTPTITVTPESFTVTPTTSTQTIPNILNNDKIGGTVTPTVGVGGNVTLTVTNPTGTTVPTLDRNTGEVTIPANTPAGSYTITYSYCEVLNPTNCTGTQTLVVTVGAVTLTVDNDIFDIPDGLTTQTTTSVLTNDRLNGNVPTAGTGGTVTITNVVPATPVRTGAKVPELNPNDGIVTIPSGTPAGTYTITYKECESLNPSSNCRTATTVVNVGVPTITVTPDPITAAPSTSTRTIPNILNNDKIGGTVTPTVGVGGNVTLTVTNPTGTTVPTLDKDTGKVTIPANTPAGNYTITYSYCEVLNPTNCTGLQTLVVTVGAVTLTVDNDIFNIPDGLTTQTTTSVLNNDRLNGNVPTAGVGGTVTITNVVPATPVRTGAKVPELNPNNGIVTIPSGTPAGTYTISYKECESLNPSSNCHTATAVINVGVPTITVTPDPITAAPSTSTRTIPNILNNDKIGGTVTPTVGVGGNVTLTVTNPTGTTVPTLDKDTGKVTIPANTPAGNYTITYSYCEVLNPTNCTGLQTLVVTVGAVTLTVDNDTFNIPDGLTTQTTTSVLNNDRLNGNVPTAGTGGTVTITNVVPATPLRTGAKVPELNPNNGIVTIPSGTPAGTYTITYKECESLNPSSNCRTATTVVNVGVPTITVTPDPITAAPSTSTRTIPNILNNDKIGGTVTPTVGVGGNVTLTVTNPTGTTVPTLDKDTGKVTIPANTPAGNYTITYSYCEVLNPTNCTGLQTLVVTVGAVTLTVDNDIFNIPDGLTTQTTTSVLNNDRLNGNVPTAGVGGTVTITNVVPATPVRTGAKVPELNPNNGIVTIPSGTPAGTYTITYKECESLNPSTNCRTATTVVNVGVPTITVTPDPITAALSTSTRTIPNILNNDKIGGTVTPTVGVGGNVTLTVTNPTGTTVPTLDRNTGEVTIPANTPAGNYTITYSYCEVLNPTNCTGLQTLVVTIMPTVIPVAVDDSATTAKGTPVTISVLANDTLNGAVTPTVVTHPTNGTAVENANGTVEYRPYTGFVGTDSFVYEICNGAGCSSATVIVKITEDIIVYNGVSVNGNDKNNHFHIDGIENYPNNKVRIYNRWGVEVFSVEGYDNVTKVFKGISDGRVTIEASERLPQGTYYYIIEYVDEHNKKQTEVGWLYLKKN